MRDQDAISESSDDSTAPSQHCVVAIDPGRSKCGLAVVDSVCQTLFRTIVPTESAVSEAARLEEIYGAQAILLGNGTGHESLLTQIRAILPYSEIHVVPESYTSEEARRRFVRETPARGVQRLLPRALRTPHAAYDDYVAMILGERYWNCS